MLFLISLITAGSKFSGTNNSSALIQHKKNVTNFLIFLAFYAQTNHFSPVLERWIRFAFPPTLLCVWVRGSETGAGAGTAVLAGALAVCVGGSFTPSIAIRTLESSCSGMLPSSDEKGLGGFSKHISQLVLPVTTVLEPSTESKSVREHITQTAESIFKMNAYHLPKRTERYVDDSFFSFFCSPTVTFWQYSHNNETQKVSTITVEGTFLMVTYLTVCVWRSLPSLVWALGQIQPRWGCLSE